MCNGIVLSKKNNVFVDRDLENNIVTITVKKSIEDDLVCINGEPTTIEEETTYTIELEDDVGVIIKETENNIEILFDRN